MNGILPTGPVLGRLALLFVALLTPAAAKKPQASDTGTEEHSSGGGSASIR
jgi:hypothetical protein